MSTPEDYEIIFRLWDEKWPVATVFVLGPPYAPFPHDERNRRAHGYARTIGEQLMYATDNMGIGLRGPHTLSAP